MSLRSDKAMSSSLRCCVSHWLFGAHSQFFLAYFLRLYLVLKEHRRGVCATKSETQECVCHEEAACREGRGGLQEGVCL